MSKQRVDRLNSLLKEVLSEVIRRDVKNPSVSELTTITRVEITRDLHYAKVYVSVIGTDEERTTTVDALNSAAGFIAITASRKVVMRIFPSLTFKVDDSIDKHIRVEELLHTIEAERQSRPHQEDNDNDESTDRSNSGHPSGQ